MWVGWPTVGAAAAGGGGDCRIRDEQADDEESRSVWPPMPAAVMDSGDPRCIEEEEE